MAVTLTTAQHDTLNYAISLYTQGSAPENQLHATVSEILAPVAVAIGFSAHTGNFLNDIRDRPLTTLLALAAFIGAP